METTNDRLAYYERMKENARQQNSTHAFGFWCGVIATEKAAQQRVHPTRLRLLVVWAFCIGFVLGLWICYAIIGGG